MGNKIITEKDFWMCTGGNVPAPLQSVQQSTKTKDGKKYITIVDTATSSYIDFGCNKLMLIMAIIAAVIAVAVVATGGAALIAVGALAGAAGAAAGAVLGGLICGQVAKLARVWLGSKNDMIVKGKPAITSGHEMKCMLFGDKISHAPNIKNWWQAIAVGSINTGAKIVEGALFGMMVGMGAGVLKGLIQLGAPTLTSVGVNIVGSFGTLGSSIRAVFGIQNVTNNWAMGKIENLTLAESKDAFIEGAIPEYEISKRIATTGEIRPSDAMLLLYLLKFKNPNKPVKEELINEKSTQKTTNLAKPEGGKAKGNFEAFEGDTKKLLETEGNVGTYKELIKKGKIGDNITPHHMPSAEYLNRNTKIKYNDGISMNMEQPSPGTGGRHRKTSTFNNNMTAAEKKVYFEKNPREALAHDIKDAKRIYKEDGLYGKTGQFDHLIPD
ncbi:hypothetical protein [Flavobacterium sp. Leaf82]|uniref:hypothetical protein n=1 Tax=Flavobacterium sp. Leaf82 TaxID=1736238 RepID=UPI000B00F7DA|nr:hypothetical protein [Flavobacterium sp. Leaf82]